MKCGGKIFVEGVAGAPIGFCDPNLSPPDVEVQDDTQNAGDDVVQVRPAWVFQASKLWGATPELLEMAKSRPPRSNGKVQPDETSVGAGGEYVKGSPAPKSKKSFELKGKGSGAKSGDETKSRFDLWRFRHRLLSGEDLDAAMFQTFLDLGGKADTVSLSQALLVRRRLSVFAAFIISRWLLVGSRRGLLRPAEKGLYFGRVLQLVDTTRAREFVRDYAIRFPQRALDLGLVDSHSGSDLAQLLLRKERVIGRARVFLEGSDHGIKVRAGKLIRMASSKKALTPAYLGELEKQAARLEHDARPVETPIPVVAEIPETRANPVVLEKRERTVTGQDLTDRAEAIWDRVNDLRGLDVDEAAERQLAAVERQCLAWLESAAVPVIELQKADDLLRRLAFESRRKNHADGSEAETQVATISQGPSDGLLVEPIDWSQFPQTLKIATAERMLRMNGFEVRSSPRGCVRFVHGETGRACILRASGRTSDMERIIALNVRSALKALERCGYAVKV